MEILLFNNKSISLLRDEMCICLDDLQCHLVTNAPAKLDFFRDFFDYLAELNPPYKNVELGSDEYYENDEYLNKKILDFSDRGRIVPNTKEYFAVDNIRHAFISFKVHGLHHLYKHREAENWYPKVIIRKKIGINKLLGESVIYRGTNKTEFEYGRFSQSWTLKEEIAHDFAFRHYLSNKAYMNTVRVILKAKINALDIYYYDETDNEYEVIVDERKIICPTIIKEAVLK